MNWKVDYGIGVTGPTCPVSRPFVREDWPYTVVRSGTEVIAVVPAQSDTLTVGKMGNPIKNSEFKNATLVAAAPDMLETGYILARLALQSERYTTDPEYRDAVDNWLTVEKLAKGES